MATARMVLRAELVHEGGRIVAHTTELSASSAFVRTDERLELGAVVDLTLSFPRLLQPMCVSARVASREAGSGHGYWAGFSLEFTDEQARVEELLRRDASAVVPGRCQILVVEDSATMRDVIFHNATRFSSAFQIEVVSTDNVEDALELVQRNELDLAVVDLFLPGPKTGADFVRELRARGTDVAAIGFSVGGPEARRAFLAAGADLFLDKPIVLRDVFATLERLVRRRLPS